MALELVVQAQVRLEGCTGCTAGKGCLIEELFVCILPKLVLDDVCRSVVTQ